MQFYELPYVSFLQEVASHKTKLKIPQTSSQKKIYIYLFPSFLHDYKVKYVKKQEPTKLSIILKNILQLLTKISTNTKFNQVEKLCMYRQEFSAGLR